MFDLIISGYRWIFLQMASVLGPGWSIVALSFICSALMAPLMKAVSGIVKRESDYQAVINPQLEAIKSAYSHDMERHLHIQRLYSRYSYSPLSAVKKVMPLFVQIPFLLLTYYMLKGTEELNGVSFFFLSDLSRPDGLIPGSVLSFLFVKGRGVVESVGSAFNLLPLIMTLFNLLTVVGTPSFDVKDRRQASVIAILFLILLYRLPSALLLYWTMNNAITLVRTLIKDNFGGARLLRHRLLSLDTIRIGIGFFLNNKRLPWMCVGCGTLSLYFFATVVAFRGDNESCHGLTFTLSMGGMFVMLSITSVVFLLMAIKNKIAWLWYCMMGVAPTCLISCALIALFIFSQQTFWDVAQYADLSCVYEVLLVFQLIGLILSKKGFGRISTSLSGLDWKKFVWFIILPIAFGLHYAFSSEGIEVSWLSAIMLCVYIVLLNCALSIICFLISNGGVVTDLLLRYATGFTCGILLIPMISTDAGFLAWQQNILIRVFIVGLMAWLFVIIKNVRSLNVFSCLVLLLSLGSVFCGNLGDKNPSTASSKVESYLGDVVTTKTNNVYLLIFDSYAHQTVREWLLHENSEENVEASLKAYGFFIYDAYSVGSGTLESMSAAFTFDGVRGETERTTMAGDNVFSELLKRSGYHTSYILCGYDMPLRGARMPGDEYFPRSAGVSRYENIIFHCLMRGYMSQTPQVFNGYTQESWVKEKRDALNAARGLPKFVYAHSAPPAHASWFPRGRKSDAEEVRLYAERQKMADEEIKSDLDLISGLDKDDIVIIASDHGPFLISPDEPGKIDARHLLDRHGIILAIRWPEDYSPSGLNINSLQHALVEVMIYLTNESSLSRLADDGVTHAMKWPVCSRSGMVKDGIMQEGLHEGCTLFDAAIEDFKK